MSKIYISSPASTRTHDSARPGDGRGDLEPQTTTFNESSLSKKGSELDNIFFNQHLRFCLVQYENLKLIGR